MQFKMVSSFQTHAVNATFFGLPAHRNRWQKVPQRKLYRVATIARIYRVQRTVARPSRTVRPPRMASPLLRLKGTTPTRAAICWLFSLASFGKYARSAIDTSGPTSGTPRSKSAFSRHAELLCILCRRSVSQSSSSCFSHSICASTLGHTSGEACPGLSPPPLHLPTPSQNVPVYAILDCLVGVTRSCKVSSFPVISHSWCGKTRVKQPCPD